MEDFRDGRRLVLIFKNKGNVQSCRNYRGIKLMSHTLKKKEMETSPEERF